MINISQLAAFESVDLWYAIPLIVVVSLVYSATRYEEAKPIMVQSLRTGVWIVSFMAVIFAILLIIAWWL